MAVPESPALIETVRVRDGRAPLWPLHVERLRRSAAALAMMLPDEIGAPAGGEDRVERLVLDAHGLHRTTRALGSTLPVHLITSSVPHPGYPHKTTSRAPFEAAQQEAVQQGADDAILLDLSGAVAESTIWALGWWQDDRLVFPPLDLGVLPSVGRRRLGQLASLHTSRLAATDLGSYACLLVNAARGVVPVATLNGHLMPADPRTAALQEQFWP